MPREYSSKYKQTQITGFYSKGKGKHRKVIPLSKHGARRKGSMTVASVVQPTKPHEETTSEFLIRSNKKVTERLERRRMEAATENGTWEAASQPMDKHVAEGRINYLFKQHPSIHYKLEQINTDNFVIYQKLGPTALKMRQVKTEKITPPKRITASKSEANIKMWEEIRANYESGKYKGGMEKYRERLVNHRISLTLGRDFNEPVETYLKRSGWKEWDEWADKEVDRIDLQRAKLLKVEKATVKDEQKGEKEYKDMAKQARKEGRPKDAKILEAHSKDEKRHAKEDAEIVAKQEKEKAKEPSVKVEYTKAEQKPQRQGTSKGQDMPTASEIETEAYRLYMVDNHGNANVTTTPERNELIEEGYIKAAQHHLMATGEQIELEKAYIENLNRDLAEHGYIAVPIGSM